MKAVIYPGASSPAFVEDAAVAEIVYPLPGDDASTRRGLRNSIDPNLEDSDDQAITLEEYWRLRCASPAPVERAEPPARDRWAHEPYDDFTIDAEIRVGRMLNQTFTVAAVASLLCTTPGAVWRRVARGSLPRPAHQGERGVGMRDMARFSSSQVVAILARHARKAAK